MKRLDTRLGSRLQSSDWVDTLFPYLEEEERNYVCPDDVDGSFAEPSYAMQNGISRMSTQDGSRIVILDYRNTSEATIVVSEAAFTNGDQDDWSDPPSDANAPGPDSRHMDTLSTLSYDGHVDVYLQEDIDPTRCSTYLEYWLPYRDRKTRSNIGPCEAGDVSNYDDDPTTGTTSTTTSTTDPTTTDTTDPTTTDTTDPTTTDPTTTDPTTTDPTTTDPTTTDTTDSD